MIIKCKMCGGDIQFNPGDTYGQCEYCGGTSTIPKVDEEQKLNRFNRANHFRRQCEFDKAVSAYEHILEEDNTNAEAHWGIVLSKFGIEYVEDPVTHERIPTCHRVQVESILADADYQDALRYAADATSRELYEKEAKRIAEIQKGILAISSQEKPYDVFICYKETDEAGNRTKDSTLAQEIYYELINEGYKVFFSRITLEDKLGQEYEPYIFAALNSAKVMLVIGTKPEFFNAVWVKNEWSRYLALMKIDRKRLLIPCYRDMDPYDLPEELSSLQSQNMSKIGFMQDLIRGVKKVIGGEKKEAAPAQATAPGISSLYRRAVLFLEDGDWESADEYFDRILDIDPEYAPAYIGKVQVQHKVRREADLARGREPLDGDSNFQKALRFAGEQQKTVYSGYNRAILDRLALEMKEAAYREAEALERRAAVEADFLKAAEKYDSAGEIRDAKSRAADCRAKASAAKAEAEKAAAVYREQMEREKKEREKQEAERRKQEEEQRKADEERQRREAKLRAEKKKQQRKVLAIVTVVVLLIAAGYGVYSKVIVPRNRYSSAQALLEEGKYDEAGAAFRALGTYSDSAEKVLETSYQKAAALLSENKPEEARPLFEAAGNYPDAAKQIEKIDSYFAAAEALKQGDYLSAMNRYRSLGDYLDAPAKAESIADPLYHQLQLALKNGDYGKAWSLLEGLGDYRDCAELKAGINQQVETALKQWTDGDPDGAEAALTGLQGWGDTVEKLAVKRQETADSLFAAEDYDKALAYYEKIGDREGISEKIAETRKRIAYRLATAALKDRDLVTAAEQFAAAGNYEEAAEQLAKIRNYQAAIEAQEKQDALGARAAFKELGDFLDSADRLETCNQTLYTAAAEKLKSGNLAGAYAIFTEIQDYSDSKAQAEKLDGDYQAAKKLLEEGKHDEAAAAFEMLGNFADSETLIKEARYRKAGALKTAGSYDEAAALYTALGDYQDSADLALESVYQKGETLLSAGDPDGAMEAFESIDYKDSQTRAKAARYEKANTLWQAGALQAAADEYKILGDYADAAENLVKVSREQADRAMAAKDYAAALNAYQNLEQTDEIKAREYELAQICYDEEKYEEATAAYETLGRYELSMSRLPVARYAWADQLFKNGEYEKAAEQFALLGEMTDSVERAKEAKYQLGLQLLGSGEYEQAKAIFNGIAGYQDADTRAKECDYQTAALLLKAGKLQEAEKLFSILGSYSDSDTCRQQCVYLQAEALLKAGDYTAAKALYDTVSYEDSVEKAKLCAYQEADRRYRDGDYAGAEEWFLSVQGYSDSADRAKESHLQQGRVLMENGDYQGALGFLDTVSHGDSAALAAKCRYELGHVAHISGDTDGAVAQYAFALTVPEAREALMSAAKDYASINETEKAIQTLWLIREEEAAMKLLLEISDLKRQTGNAELALLARLAAEDLAEETGSLLAEIGYEGFERALNNCSLLSENQQFRPAVRYTCGQVALKAQDWNDAVTAFEAAGDYSDAKTQILETKYQQARSIYDSGDYAAALTTYQNLSGYKDVDKLLQSDDHLLAAAAAREAKLAPYKTVGSTVTFGQYEQDNNSGNGQEAIEWIVLDVQDGKSLLLSKYGLDAKPYNTEYTSITWEKCTLRNWLNNDFLNAAFTDAEKSAILMTNIDNSSSQGYSGWSTSGGNNTQDQIFLLSYAEANKHLGVTYNDSNNTKSRVAPTAYAKANGAYTSDSYKTADGEATGWWWLRSPGNSQDSAAYASNDGSLRYNSVNDVHGVARPAFWLNLESDIF